MDFEKNLFKRIENRKSKSVFNVHTLLEHFSIISFKVPIKRIEKYIPSPFKLWTFESKGENYALISAVPFMDKDFCFHNLIKYPKFSFYQTNFRAYVIDTRTNEHCAWFFATNLGSPTYVIPKYVWKMPWEYAKYDFIGNVKDGVYTQYEIGIKSSIGNAEVRFEGTDKEMPLLEGFENIEEQKLILTHPVLGYYDQGKYEIGMYEIWHPELDLKVANSSVTHFDFFENLGLLSREEMEDPHSVLVTESIEFEIVLPPKLAFK